MPPKRLSFACLRRVGGGREDFLFPKKRAGTFFLRLLALGNVHMRTRDAVRNAGGIAQGHAARQNPAVRAVLMAEAILAFIVRGGAVDVGLIRSQNTLAILRMKPLFPFLDPRSNLVVFVAEDALPTR